MRPLQVDIKHRERANAQMLRTIVSRMQLCLIIEGVLCTNVSSERANNTLAWSLTERYSANEYVCIHPENQDASSGIHESANDNYSASS